MKKITALLLALLMLSAMAALAEDATPLWLQPYDETVTITFGRTGTATNPQFVEGESIDNNYYTEWIKSQFNIELENVWLLDDANSEYTTKVNLAMATGDFPDLFMVRSSSAKIQLRQLIEAGFLADLAPYFDDYASDLTKDIIESYGGMDVMFGNAVRDDAGGIYAIPYTSAGGEYDFVWVRTDWLEKVGMEKPTTIAELLDVARAFQANNLGGENTVGIEIRNDAGAAYNTPASLSYLYYNFHAYPQFWYLDEASGDYVYGSVQPEAKEALAFLADLYAEGILDKEFVTKDFTASLAAGQSGIMFGGWWMGAWPLNDSKANDPDAYWEPIWVIHDDGQYNTITPDVADESIYWCASAKCENPEALITLMNINAEQQNLYNIEKYDEFPKHIPQEVDTHYNDTEYTFDWGSWPVNMKVRYANQMERLAVVWLDLVAEVEAGNEIPVFATESFDGRTIVAYKRGEDNSVNGMHVYGKTLGQEMTVANKDLFAPQPVYNPAPTTTMEFSWTNLLDLEKQAYIKIIMGEEPIDYFDTFVADWMAQGGQTITGEVNAQAKGQ